MCPEPPRVCALERVCAFERLPEVITDTRLVSETADFREPSETGLVDTLEDTRLLAAAADFLGLSLTGLGTAEFLGLSLTESTLEN